MKDTQIRIRITVAEKETIRQVAVQKGKTISNVVRETFGLAPSNAPRSDYQ